MNMGALMWRAEKQLRVYNLQYRDAFGYCWKCALEDAYKNSAGTETLNGVNLFYPRQDRTVEDLA